MVCIDPKHEFIIAVMGSKGYYPSKETVNTPSLIDTWIRVLLSVVISKAVSDTQPPRSPAGLVTGSRSHVTHNLYNNNNNNNNNLIYRG